MIFQWLVASASSRHMRKIMIKRHAEQPKMRRCLRLPDVKDQRFAIPRLVEEI